MLNPTPIRGFTHRYVADTADAIFVAIGRSVTNDPRSGTTTALLRRGCIPSQSLCTRGIASHVRSRGDQLGVDVLVVFWIRPCVCRPLSRRWPSGGLPMPLIWMILVPAFPSRRNTISIPSARKGVCARRRRPASACGFFGQLRQENRSPEHPTPRDRS